LRSLLDDDSRRLEEADISHKCTQGKRQFTPQNSDKVGVKGKVPDRIR
jgi:DNA-binding helix-hairpin-helix protein with protein kinase domain